MTKLTIIIRYNAEKHTVPTQSDIILEDLIQQLSDRGVLPNQTFVATKYGTETALDLGATLEEMAFRITMSSTSLSPPRRVPLWHSEFLSRTSFPIVRWPECPAAGLYERSTYHGDQNRPAGAYPAF